MGTIQRILVAAVLFAGMTIGKAQATELVLWHAYRGAEKATIEKVAKLYESKMAGKAKVTTLAIPYDAYADKISASIPRGKGPDVFIYAQDRLGGWVESGKTVEPIGFYMDDATHKQFLPGMLDAMTYKGTIYGLPLNYKSITLIYNKALVKTPPKNTTELVKIAKALTDANSGRYGLAYWYTNFYFHAALMNAFGGRVFDQDGKLVLNSPETVASIKQMMKWYKQDGIMPTEPSETLVSSMFNEGKVGMVFNGPWYIGEISPNIDYGLAVLPVVDEAGKKPMRPWLTIEGAYVSASSKQKEAAYDFVAFLASEEAGLLLSLEGRQLHTNAAIYNDKRVASDRILKAFHDQLSSAEPMPNRAEMTMVWSPVTTAMNKVVKGNSTPEAALREAAAAVQESITALHKGR
ncbi:MAG: extracellular solute-binding protein [Gammaproteobacteria bacterium]|nr:extracellular solute-binding protein [Gammaproteobacteria bacterium]MDD2928568.1 extracellular solute-binding protein [Sideroxydans sp.]MDD5470760.1 extracellular solute-binding protein [Sideroxydans sp.]